MAIEMREDRGSVLVETVIALPLLLMLVFGIISFSTAHEQKVSLTNAAREGARVAVIQGTTDPNITATVRNYMQGGALPNYATAAVTIIHGVPLTGSDLGTQVKIDYPFSFIVLNPVVRLVAPSSATGSPITMHSTAVMRNEFSGS